MYIFCGCFKFHCEINFRDFFCINSLGPFRESPSPHKIFDTSFIEKRKFVATLI